ncbi:MAG: hypothetical protein ACKVJH_07560 [Flavobacteriales bacterium]
MQHPKHHFLIDTLYLTAVVISFGLIYAYDDNASNALMYLVACNVVNSTVNIVVTLGLLNTPFS